jgi:polysaccharide biosynthesis transport protein
MTSHRRIHAGSQTPAGTTPNINARLVLAGLRRWWIIPLQVVLIAASVAAICYTFKPMYEAVVLLRISSDTPYVVFRSREDNKQFIRNQVELIQSELVLGKLVSDPRIARLLKDSENPLAELTENVKVASIGDSDLFRISYTGYDAKDAAMVANEVSKRYFDLRDDYDAARTQRVIDLLDEEKQARELGVKQLRDNVRELAKKHSVNLTFAPVPAGNMVATRESGVPAPSGNPLAEIQQRIATAVVEQAVLKAKITAYEEWNQKQTVHVPSAIVDQAIEQSPQVQELLTRISANQAMLQEYEKLGQNPQETAYYKQQLRELERNENALEDLRGTLRPRILDQLKVTEVSRRENELAGLRMQLENSEIAQKAMEQQLNDQIANVRQSSDDTVDLDFKMAELARANQVLDLIETRALELRTERRAPERVEALQEATPPSLPVEKLPFKHLALAIMASLCLPVGLAVALEYQAHRVNDAEQLQQNSQLSVVGEITNLPERTKSASRAATIRVSRDLSLFEESVDILRTGLVLGNDQDLMQILAVTSACTREGKTSIATQLALSIARSTEDKTLLIDGDMRSPDVHALFDIPLEPGLVDVLDRQCELEDAVKTTCDENLYVLSAGKLQQSPHKLLGNESFAGLLEEARKTFKYIVIDTPPVLACGESLILAKAADVTLLCAMRNVSRVKQVRMVYDRLKAADANPIGVVLNGVPAKRYVYAYGYYGYSNS